MKIVYVDMDGVLADFDATVAKYPFSVQREYRNKLDQLPGVFYNLEPIKDAVESFIWLRERFDTYILSTPSWNKVDSWISKRMWVEKHLGEHAHKRLILSHHKNLNTGDFLIDDRLKNGADRFTGTHIHFGTQLFPDWRTVTTFLERFV